MILNKAIEYLNTLKNINEIDCIHSLSSARQLNSEPVDFRVNVVGDLHGQFIDLFTIFDLNDLPSASNQYLFNGDFVDRGAQQCEVYFTLLYGLVLYGSKYKSFYLNRGNHEDYGCSVRFGFKEEVMTKYCLYSKIIMRKCAQTFALLPVGSIITQQGTRDQLNKILVVHGGVSNETDLEIIRNLDRSNYASLDGTSSKSLNEKEKKEREQLQDLLWSDPQVIIIFFKTFIVL